MEQDNKITVLLFEPGEYPRIIEIEESLEAMQKTVGGYIEQYMPFDDEVAIICNEEGKLHGAELNRAIYSEPEQIEMNYQRLKDYFQLSESVCSHTTGYIVFTQDSFDKPYSEAERTYVISSNNKAFIKGVDGYSIYGSSLDGSDRNVRLEKYMYNEQGGTDGWRIEKCYVKDDSNVKIVDVIAGTFFIAYAPAESEKFLSMPPKMLEKYMDMFRCPEHFTFTNGKIEAIPYEPISIEGGVVFE